MNDTNNEENNVSTTPSQPVNAATPEVPTQPTAEVTTPPHTFTMDTEDNKEEVKEKRGFRAWYTKHAGIISLLQLIGGPILLVVLINAFVFQPYQVYGSSMVPTLHEGDRLIINKFGKSWSRLLRGDHVPKRGDIIVFKTNLKDNIQLIKRVVGLPGEKVVVKDGIITVYNDKNPNGFNPDDGWKDHLPDARTGNHQEITLGEDELFVSGDNRTQGGSLDSRNDLGPISIDNVVGELVFRMFPLNDAELF